jgi:hypothetical protein
MSTSQKTTTTAKQSRASNSKADTIILPRRLTPEMRSAMHLAAKVTADICVAPLQDVVYAAAIAAACHPELKPMELVLFAIETLTADIQAKRIKRRSSHRAVTTK